MKRVLIFDFGGVLMKTVDYTPRYHWDDQLGLAHGSVERVVHGSPTWLQAQTGQIPVTEYWQDVAQQLKLSDVDIKQLAHDFYSGDQLDQDHIQFIKEMKAQGHQVALLSNDSTDLNAKLDHLNLHDLFDPLVISAYIGVMKPNAAAYHAVLKLLKRPAEETIFIDDRIENVEAAKKIGIHGVHYQPNINLVATLTPLLVQ